MFHLAEHHCGDSMLKCIDCDSQICPKCMVQCPVGNRCRNCTKRFTSHLLQVDFWAILRHFIAAFVAGLLFACLQGIFPLVGFFMLLFVYLIGSFVGNIIFKVSGRKLGPKVAVTVAVGLLAGSFCLSFAWQNLYGLAIKHVIAQSMDTNANRTLKYSIDGSATQPGNGGHQTGSTASSGISDNNDSNDFDEVNTVDHSSAIVQASGNRSLAPPPISLSLIVFILGVISPFLGWSNPFSGFFRRY